MHADKISYSQISLGALQIRLRRIRRFAEHFVADRRNHNTDRRYTAKFFVAMVPHRDAVEELRATLFRMPELIWADLEVKPDHKGQQGVWVDAVARDKEFDLKLVSGLIRKAGVSYSTSSTTRVRGYHNVSNGFKPQSEFDGSVMIYHVGREGFNGSDKDWDAIRAQLDAAGLVYSNQPGVNGHHPFIRVYGFRPEVVSA